MDNKYVYTSSDGTEKDVRDLHTEYIINALAKAHREFYSNEITDETRNKYVRNITVLENELNDRQIKFLTEKLQNKIEEKFNDAN